MQEKGILAYWFNLDEEIVDEWADWYIRDHMPSRLGATFTGARCLRAVDDPRSFMALYETPTVDALMAPEYLALLRKPSDADKRRRGWYQNTVRGCCRLAADFGFGHGGVVASVRFTPRAPSPPQDVLAALAEQGAAFERIGRLSLLVADPAVRAKMDEARVTGHGDGAADHIISIECSNARDARQAVERLTADQRWSKVADTGAVQVGIYDLLYSIAK